MELFLIHLPASIDETTFERLLHLLPPEAQARIRRFRFREDALRSLIGRLAPICYLRQKGVTSCEFSTTSTGKPIITTPLSPPVAFNISHDGPYVLFGVDADEIGVDLMECPQDPLDLQEALSEQLSPYERNVLNAAVSNSIRSHLLMTLWTVKEAYVKAIGEGIGFGLDRIVVEFELSKLDSQSTPSLPAVHRVTVDGENVAARGWSLAFGTIGRDPISVTNSTRSYAWAAFHRGEKDAPELQHVQWDGFIAAFTQA